MLVDFLYLKYFEITPPKESEKCKFPKFDFFPPSNFNANFAKFSTKAMFMCPNVLNVPKLHVVEIYSYM